MLEKLSVISHEFVVIFYLLLYILQVTKFYNLRIFIKLCVYVLKTV